MTKAEIIEKVFEQGHFSKKDCTELVETFFGTMKEAFEDGENLKISGFGNFEVKSKAERKGRNPISGDSITIEARKVLTFKPSSILKQAINSTAG